MKRILIAYASKYGQTRKVAVRIAKVLQTDGHEVELFDVESSKSVSVTDFDAVIAGGALYAGRHSARLTKFVKAQVQDLREKPTAFFSLSLSAGGTDQQKSDAESCVQSFLERTEWRTPLTHIIAGAVQYRDYGFFTRLLMKWQLKRAGGDTDTSRNFEYTDWEDVEEFAHKFAEQISGRGVVANT